MVYQANEWKRSTVDTLEKLKAENDKGNSPSASFFRNGAIAAWLKILKEGNYVDNEKGNGYKINEKGIVLLEQLRKNPPKRRRNKKQKNIEETKSIGHSQKNQSQSFTIEINGQGFNVKIPFDSTHEKILKALTKFQEETK